MDTRVGLWDAVYAAAQPRAIYGDPITAERAGHFLRQREIATVEDWGCGLGGFRVYLGAWQTYVGLDGSRSPYADRIVDLERYTSDADAIHLRHVLEHNPNWESVLRNALRSFRRRMVLTLFTPWAERTRVLAEYPGFLGSDATMVDIAFCRDDIVCRFDGIEWTSEENIATRSQYGVEHMFFLRRR